MRQFYQCFLIWPTVSAKLGWSHYSLILTIDSPEARNYYINEVISRQLSVRELERLIKTSAYEREKRNQVTYDNEIKNTEISQIKDPYVIEFSKNIFKEINLEDSIVDNMSKFLLELGKGYAYVARQKKLKIDNKTYYVDLVFYNSILNCYVLIDLKINKLDYSALGQMDMYCNYYDENIITKEQNKTIGLILEKEKDEYLIQYSSLLRDKSIYVSIYKNYIPSKEEILKIVKKS